MAPMAPLAPLAPMLHMAPMAPIAAVPLVPPTAPMSAPLPPFARMVPVASIPSRLFEKQPHTVSTPPVFCEHALHINVLYRVHGISFSVFTILHTEQVEGVFLLHAKVHAYTYKLTN